MKDQEIENKKMWFRRYYKLLLAEDRLRNKLETLEESLYTPKCIELCSQKNDTDTLISK